MEKAGKPKIIVAGGGIGGLTAALSLIKRGFEVEIYEQAPILQEIGAGVQISANGMLVFHELGLAARVMEEAAHPQRREIRMWNTGQAWTAFDLGTVSVQTYGHPYVTMFRPDLLAILSDAVTTAAPGALRLGQRAVGCETVGERVILRFDDGSTAEGDALIGADGIHSVIRAGLHGSDNAEFTGLVAWRGVIPIQDLPPRLARSVSSNWVGPGRHVVQYPLRRGTLMNFVGVVEREDWREESWTTPGSHADMLADFAGWHDDVQTLITAIPQPYLWAFKLAPSASVMVGRPRHAARRRLPSDAAVPRARRRHGDRGRLHPVPSSRGAWHETLPPHSALMNSARHERTSRIVIGSADNTKRFHNPLLGDPAAAQAYVEREWAEDRLRERYDWMYRYDATAVAV